MRHHGRFSSGIAWIKSFFRPSNHQEPLKVHLARETYAFHFISRFTSILIGLHVIFGTLAFSSLIFISVRDSLIVVARFMASMVCCRVILVYELAVLRDRANREPATKGLEQERVEDNPKGSSV